MKTIRMLAVATTLVAAAVAPMAASGPLDTVLDPYFRIQSQLADDRTDTVKADAEAVAQAAAALGPQGEALQAAARELSAVSDLAAARDAFGKLSDALVAYADGTRATVGDDVATVYCPMVKKSWMQKGKEVRNPYFGKSMLGCGQVRKKG